MTQDHLRGHLDALVLAALSEGPAHGYSIIARVRERSDGAFDLAEGTVYPILHRLEEEGKLSSKWVRVESRRRRIYTITSTGKRQLSRHRESWLSFSGRLTRALGMAPA